MTNSTTQQSVLFPDLFDKPLVVTFDQEHSSSDGGAILLKAADKRLGLTDSLSACLRDERQSGKIDHDTGELFRQRVYGIACGYADCNDAARLASDPVHKMINDRDPIEGDALASQSTLSRFENSVGPLTLYRMGKALFENVIETHRKRLRGHKVRRIVIDLDPTDDPTHGSQQRRSSTGITTPGATCRSWALSASTTSPTSTCLPRSSGRGMPPRRVER